MRKLILTALATALMVPAVVAPAAAQSRGEIRRDARDLREEQRELRRAERFGTPRDVRRERRDVRDARRDLNDSIRERRWRDDDWRDYRRGNRAVYARGNWRAPFAYQRFRPGARIAPRYYGDRYFIGNPGRYRLPPPGRYNRWVRHYDDVLLVDVRRGYVIRSIPGFYW